MLTESASTKRHGRHYTPTDLALFLAERVLHQIGDQQDVRVLDPACGDGELLLAIDQVAKQRRPDMRLELVGYDLDSDAIAVAETRARDLDVDATWHQGDFLEAGRELSPRSFDAIISNPPYVRTQQLGQEASKALAADFGLKGRIDLTHPFVTLFPALLRDNGVLGLLCSNRFLSTKAGANVRAVFQTSLQPVELYDLGDTKLFRAAVLPAIVVALNQAPAPEVSCYFSSAYEDESGQPDTIKGLYESLTSDGDTTVTHEGRTISIRVGTLVPSTSPAEPWRLSHRSGDDWLRAIRKATWKTFADVAKIRVGIKTTADSVFISDNWESAQPVPDKDLLLPLVTQANVTPWRISKNLETKVLYPYDLGSVKRVLVDMSLYPSSMTYLEGHSERLKGRKYVIESGREWYEIWVPQKPAMWSVPKIVFPDISVDARFAYDKSGAIVNGNCYWISVADIGDEGLAYLMIAVANSRLGVRFYDEVCGNKLYSGRRRWMTQYVGKLPLPDPSLDTSRRLIALTKSICESEGEVTPGELSEVDRLVRQSFEGAMDVAVTGPASDTLF